jgi:hypothetical protein
LFQVAITKLTAIKAASIMFAAAVCLLFVTGMSRPSYACTCVARTPDEYFSDAAVVFVGKVVDVGRLEGDYEVTFNVSRYWKGLSENDRFVAVHLHSMDTGICGYPVKEGEEYLTYASRSNGQLAIGACEGTGRLNGEYDPVAVLGAGSVPRGDVIFADPDPLDSAAQAVPDKLDFVLVFIAAAIAALSAGIAALVIRKR